MRVLLAIALLSVSAAAEEELMCRGLPTNLRLSTLTATTVNGTTGNFAAMNAGFADAGTLLVTGTATAARYTVTGALSSDGIALASDSNRITWPGGVQLDGPGALRSNAGFNASAGSWTNNGKVWGSNTAPTVTACAGGTVASMTASNGTFAFQFDVGTACAGETTAVLTFPAATVGWVCSCSVTTADRFVVQRTMPSASTTQVTLDHGTISTGATGTAWTDSADVACMCLGL